MSKTIKKTIFNLLLVVLIFSKPAAGQEMEAFVPQGYSLIPPAPKVAALVSYIETPWERQSQDFTSN